MNIYLTACNVQMLVLVTSARITEPDLHVAFGLRT